MTPAFDTRTQRSLIAAAFLAVAAFLIGISLGLMPSKAAMLQAPVPQTASPVLEIAHPSLAGRALFVQNCAHCHGDDAAGSGEDGDGPDLHGLAISNARIATVVHHGIKGEMPSFSKKLTPADTAALIEYLRSLH